MHLFFDESGDYAFPTDRFDCYAQAALICPDSMLSEIAAFVDEKRTSWGATELHAAELEPDQVLEIAEFIGGSEVQLLAHVTDSVIVTLDGISQFRLEQAGTTKRTSIATGARRRRRAAHRPWTSNAGWIATSSARG